MLEFELAGWRSALALAGALVALGWLPGASAESGADADAMHAGILLEDRFPPATECGSCHPRHYRQWSISQHAYAQMSPVFNAMHGKILKLTNGTNGDFCIRCHTPVGMNLGEAEFMSNIDRYPTSREGVTCIVCHRLNQNYGKLSGRLSVVEGDLTKPIYGPRGDPAELNQAIQAGGLVTEAGRSGRQVHAELELFEPIRTPAFCGSCHDVTLVNGFRLEEAFSEYKSSPAARRGITCHDCHMGKEPGKVLAEKSDPEFERKNYDFGPAAQVGRHHTADRKLTDHRFVGPDYSVLSPALFPLNIAAVREESEKDDPSARGMATIREWLEFDWEAGWGTDDFEDEVDDDHPFPERWASVDDRYDARELIEDNLELLEEMTALRLKLLQAGYQIGEIRAEAPGRKGVRFRVEVRNATDGHNVPTGFDAERLVWLHVRVTDSNGALVLESGDLDPNGDVRDLHSAYVHNHELPLDKQLFSLQSRFVTSGVRGGEREQVLAVNYSVSPLPFIRPETRSSILLGRPGGARKHKMGIAPGASRWAEYRLDREGVPPYRAVIELKAAMVPVNLLNEIRDVGFDYNMSAADIARNLVAGHQVIESREFILDPGLQTQDRRSVAR